MLNKKILFRSILFIISFISFFSLFFNYENKLYGLMHYTLLSTLITSAYIVFLLINKKNLNVSLSVVTYEVVMIIIVPTIMFESISLKSIDELAAHLLIPILLIFDLFKFQLSSNSQIEFNFKTFSKVLIFPITYLFLTLTVGIYFEAVPYSFLNFNKLSIFQLLILLIMFVCLYFLIYIVLFMFVNKKTSGSFFISDKINYKTLSLFSIIFVISLLSIIVSGDIFFDQKVHYVTSYPDLFYTSTGELIYKGINEDGCFGLEGEMFVELEYDYNCSKYKYTFGDYMYSIDIDYNSNEASIFISNLVLKKVTNVTYTFLEAEEPFIRGTSNIVDKIVNDEIYISYSIEDEKFPLRKFIKLDEHGNELYNFDYYSAYHPNVFDSYLKFVNYEGKEKVIDKTTFDELETYTKTPLDKYSFYNYDLIVDSNIVYIVSNIYYLEDGKYKEKFSIKKYQDDLFQHEFHIIKDRITFSDNLILQSKINTTFKVDKFKYLDDKFIYLKYKLDGFEVYNIDLNLQYSHTSINTTYNYVSIIDEESFLVTNLYRGLGSFEYYEYANTLIIDKNNNRKKLVDKYVYFRNA